VTRHSLAAIAALLLIACLSCGPDRVAAGPPVRVLAAASLGDVMRELAIDYRAQGGAVEISEGPSGALAVQVRRGVPSEIVVFAGQRPMDELERAGFLEPGSRINLLSNSLIIVVRDTYGGNVTSLADLAERFEGKIAIADPDLAPAGEYAIAALQSAGVLERVQGRLVRSLDVRAATASVSLGTADAAVVYTTDAIGVENIRVAGTIPPETYPEIVYPAAVLNGARDLDGAHRFMEYLKSERASATFRSHGFTRLAAMR